MGSDHFRIPDNTMIFSRQQFLSMVIIKLMIFDSLMRLKETEFYLFFFQKMGGQKLFYWQLYIR